VAEQSSEDDYEDNSSNSVEDSDGEDVKPFPRKRKATVGPNATAAKTKISGKAKVKGDEDDNTVLKKSHATNRRRARSSIAASAKLEVVDLLNSFNSDSDKRGQKTSTKSKSGRKAKASSSAVNLSSDESGGEDSEFSEPMKEGVKVIATTKVTVPISRKPRNKINGNIVESGKPKFDVSQNGNDSSASTEKIGNESPSRKRKVSLLEPPYNMKSAPTNNLSGSASTPLSSTSSTVSKSPFRSRRKSPLGKAPNSIKQSKVLDLTKDDEFHFG
jgi:hypothetical protein